MSTLFARSVTSAARRLHFYIMLRNTRAVGNNAKNVLGAAALINCERK